MHGMFGSYGRKDSMTPDPLGLAHRIHVSTNSTGYRASCTCGWRTVRRTRQLRDQAITAHEQRSPGDDAA
jgi:hypothetical protein